MNKVFLSRTKIGFFAILLMIAVVGWMYSGCRRGEQSKDISAQSEKDRSAQEHTRPKTGAPAAQPATAREVLERMVAAYRQAESYADGGRLHLLAQAGEQKIDQTSNYSVSLVRPNKLRLMAYQGSLICDGQEIRATVESIADQVLVRPAPQTLDMKVMRLDPNLTMALSDFAGPPPVLYLLLADNATDILLRDAEEPELLESGEIEAHECYRVRIRRPDGIGVFWIDKETFVLRRIVFPTDVLRREMSQNQPVESISLVADLAGAALNVKMPPSAFQFQKPLGTETVEFFIPPHIAQLLNRPVPRFSFRTLDGESVSPQTLAGKITVLDFWATWCAPCRQSLPKLEQVRKRYEDNPKVVFFAVSIDDPQVKDEELKKVFEELQVRLPILRDTENAAELFKFDAIPVMFIIDAKGMVQHCQAGAEENLEESLPQKIDKLLAGEDIYHEPRKQYLEQVEQLRQYAKSWANEEKPPTEGTVREEKLPEVKTAPPSKPTSLKLVPLWTCAELSSPGNIVVVAGGEQPRILVVEGWKAVAEVSPVGKLLKTHQLPLAQNEVVGTLRAAVDGGGRLYYAAFLLSQQRCHIFDEQWNLVAHYPDDALQHPHAGLADVQLGDLEGDGRLKLYVGYWGTVGVQAASLKGERLWANRTLSNVASLAIGPADREGRRELYCANGIGNIAVLDAQGERRRELTVSHRVLQWIVGVQAESAGQMFWCGLAAGRPGENLAVGFSAEGEELWTYQLPSGVQPRPIEPIFFGKLVPQTPGQWLLPAPDGSIHILALDGKLVDKFNYGEELQGLAVAEIDQQPVLIVAGGKGLKAWKVEAPAEASSSGQQPTGNK